MKGQIIISRYNEDLSWVKQMVNEDIEIFIYNKGPKIIEEYSPKVKISDLENVGRESHTYLHHIINNYDELPEKIIFTQFGASQLEEPWDLVFKLLSGLILGLSGMDMVVKVFGVICLILAVEGIISSYLSKSGEKVEPAV
mgnify:CR=1 FL=1